MNKLLFLITVLTNSSMAYADEWVNSYTRQNGTHVDGYHRTAPDSNLYNNYSSPGNVNPYTGSVGGYQSQSQQFGNGQTFGGSPQPLGGAYQPHGGNHR